MSTAHLVVTIDYTQSPPVVVHVGIYSSGPGGLTVMAGEAMAELTRDSGDDYAEASKNLLRVVRNLRSYSWVLPFLGVS